MTRKKIGIGAEGLIHKQFASIIRGYEAYNKLNCLYWSYNASGEKRTPMTGALLKAKGLNKGMADYVFFQKKSLPDTVPKFYLNVIFIEFKAGKNKQSDSQKNFESKFIDLFNCKYYTCYSVNEAINVLEKENIIKQ